MEGQRLATPAQSVPPEWLPRLLDWLDSLQKVKANWDGYDADPPRPEMIEAAKKFIRTLTEKTTIAQPNACPTPVGGILFAWEHAPHQLEVEFEPEKSAAFLYLNTETDEGEEAVLPDPPETDHEFMSRVRLFEA